MEQVKKLWSVLLFLLAIAGFVIWLGMFLPPGHAFTPAMKEVRPPAPRYGAGIAYNEYLDTWYAFGGRGLNGFENTLYEWDKTARRWLEVTPESGSPLPPPRAFPAVASIWDRNEFFVFGGEDDDYFAKGDTWVYDFVQHWWIPFKPLAGDENPDPRTKAVANYTPAKVNMRGGCPTIEDGPYFTDEWFFDPIEGKWHR